MKYADRPFIVEMKRRKKKAGSGAIWSDVDRKALKQALDLIDDEQPVAADPLSPLSTPRMISTVPGCRSAGTVSYE